ncbi:hypothetical protein L1987_03116 [Smallanthus sonchifolius]|uniref:Uncharacterized protein n=1 Tax=Smallanthus sonchifolius TaxID=185202 RepID=A0ACB9K9U6_9ASTR|nr:hypothetical protein L1987_03116 [Smallanthus sonchifolius]
MMAQPSDAPVFPPFSVISPQFIAPYPLELIVDKYPCRNIVITDINHKIIFKVKPHNKRLHRQRVLLDPNDKPIAMLRDKMHKPETSKYGKDKFTVTIQPNIDYACVVALLAIVDAMENPDEKKDSSGAVEAVVNVMGTVLTS